MSLDLSFYPKNNPLIIDYLNGLSAKVVTKSSRIN